MSLRPVRVVLQARTDSARLPAKVLLPVAARPLSILAAQRLGNTGLPVTLATSDRSVDDTLAAATQAAGIPLFRGSADDVLSRVVGACASLPEDTVVVRATGDNLFPDGQLVELLVERLEQQGSDIAGIRWPESRLPYGVSLEAARLAALRAANALSLDAYDREHVTPYLWRGGRTAILHFPGEPDTSRLRATIDLLDDYLRIEPLFAAGGDPVMISWRDLVVRLAERPAEPATAVPIRQLAAGPQSELVLGTAQLGMDYGRGPVRSQPGAADATQIVRTAIRHGVTHIDTARAYGDSEEAIGNALDAGWSSRAQVITKLSPALGSADARASDIADAAEASVFRSLHALKLPRLQTLLLHRPAHRTTWGGAVWKRLAEMRAAGFVGRLGVSVSSPAEMLDAAAEETVGLVQFPCNLLDWRWDQSLSQVARLRGPSIILHARSVFLQGLLLQDDLSLWPAFEGSPAGLTDALKSAAATLGRKSVADLAVAYMREKPNVDALVIGIPSLTVLQDTLALFQAPRLSREDSARFDAMRPKVPAALLDPSTWPAIGQT